MKHNEQAHPGRREAGSIASAPVIAWQRPLNRRGIKTLGLASLGGSLEFYYFVVFVFFTATIGQLFFPPDIPDWLRQLQAYGIFAAGYFARPLGGLIMAHFGDRAGRKRMFTLSVFLMAVPTILIRFLPAHSSIGYFVPPRLLGFRGVPGGAIGGGRAGGWGFGAAPMAGTRNRFA